MSRIYYRGARAAIVCYGEGSGLVTVAVGLGRTRGPGAGPDTSLPDLTNSSSFQRAKFWVNELQNCEEVTLRTSCVLGLFSGWGLTEGLGTRSGCSACCPRRAAESTCVAPRVTCWRRTGGSETLTSTTCRTMPMVGPFPAPRSHRARLLHLPLSGGCGGSLGNGALALPGASPARCVPAEPGAAHSCVLGTCQCTGSSHS